MDFGILKIGLKNNYQQLQQKHDFSLLVIVYIVLE